MQAAPPLLRHAGILAPASAVHRRVSAAVSKTGRARWVDVHEVIFQAVLDLCPRDDRTPARLVFQGFNAAAFRTQLGRVCIAAGVPAFSPHDLRHRRISLLLRGGVDPVTVSRHLGHRPRLDEPGHLRPRPSRGRRTRLRGAHRLDPSSFDFSPTLIA